VDFHNFFFFLFFVGISSTLAFFLDFGVGAALPKQGKVEKIVLRILILVVAVYTTLQASVMFGFIGLVK